MTGAGFPLGVEERGSGSHPLVLIHGFGANASTWRHWVPALEDDHRLLVVELKGHGAAPKPRDRAYGPRDQAELVVRLLREQVDAYGRILETADGRRAILQAARQIVPDDLETIAARYPEIPYPTLLLWGREDRVVPTWVGERLARALPRAHLEILDGCGHIPPEERPEESLRALRRFLREAEDGPGGEDAGGRTAPAPDEGARR